jgi:hypothetical protein
MNQNSEGCFNICVLRNSRPATWLPVGCSPFLSVEHPARTHLLAHALGDLALKRGLNRLADFLRKIGVLLRRAAGSVHVDVAELNGNRSIAARHSSGGYARDARRNQAAIQFLLPLFRALGSRRGVNRLPPALRMTGSAQTSWQHRLALARPCVGSR